MSQRIPFRRRNFFIKHAFQTKFALYPIFFLLLFLVYAGLSLYASLQETLRLQMYMPHSHLQNTWDELAPALAQVSLRGGVVFVGLLCLWVWRRFSRLRRDLDRVADWLAGLHGGEAQQPLAVEDREVRLLYAELAAAVEFHAQWERQLAERAAELQARLAAPGAVEAADAAAVRAAVEGLAAQLAGLQVDERLS